MIAYENETTGRRDYHVPISRHAFNPPHARRRRRGWLLLVLGAWLGLVAILILGAVLR